MAFKTMKSYNEERFGDLFLLRDDGESADVIFMYRNEDDVLVADTHYVKSAEYSGYVHCCGAGCPACGRGIRVQTKLFIPLYNLTTRRIEFFDRSIRFESQLNRDVFSRFPNPCDFVFRITRHGAANDVNTTYEISAVGRNSSMSYDAILKSVGVVFPNYYEKICREYSVSELGRILSAPSNSYADASNAASITADYKITPRVSSVDAAESIPSIPSIAIDDSDDAFSDEAILKNLSDVNSVDDEDPDF